jgi:hypothetical protein
MRRASEQTQAEHLAWAKARALKALDAGDFNGAVVGMVRDLRLHDAWAADTARGRALPHLLTAIGFEISDSAAVRRWIEDFF